MLVVCCCLVWFGLNERGTFVPRCCSRQLWLTTTTTTTTTAATTTTTTTTVLSWWLVRWPALQQHNRRPHCVSSWPSIVLEDAGGDSRSAHLELPPSSLQRARTTHQRSQLKDERFDFTHKHKEHHSRRYLSIISAVRTMSQTPHHCVSKKGFKRTQMTVSFVKIFQFDTLVDSTNDEC